MNYIENVYICLVAPVIVALFVVHRFRRRGMLFSACGMTACLFSAYVSSFFARVLEADPLATSLEISPVVEEVMKLIPLVFYLLVYDPPKEEITSEALMIAVGFATLENACYLIANGTQNTLRLLLRGFSTGAMHVACGAAVAIILTGFWDRMYLRIAGMLGAMCLAITWHGIFNVLVNQEGAVAIVGFMLPILTGIAVVAIRRKIYGPVPVPGSRPPGMPPENPAI